MLFFRSALLDTISFLFRYSEVVYISLPSITILLASDDVPRPLFSACSPVPPVRYAAPPAS